MTYFPLDGYPAAPMNPVYAALLVLMFSALAEALHTRRVRVAARLAFGPEGRSRGWTVIAPFLRCLSLAAFAWGLAVTWQLHLAAKDGKPAETTEPTRLVFVADLSPSMYLKDAGPEG